MGILNVYRTSYDAIYDGIVYVLQYGK